MSNCLHENIVKVGYMQLVDADSLYLFHRCGDCNIPLPKAKIVFTTEEEAK